MQRIVAWLVLVSIGWMMATCTPGQRMPPLVRQETGGVSLTPTPATGALARLLPQVRSLPQVIAEISLTTADATLLDGLLDSVAQRLYITDTAGNLYILAADTYALLATLSALGTLTLDQDHDRLYVAPGAGALVGAEAKGVTVVDTRTNTVVGTLPGPYVAVDSVADRLFVGETVDTDPQSEQPGVRIYDGATLAQRGELPQAGVPFYNPLRNELLILAHTVYVVDLATQTVTADLFPELAQQAMPWCNGCTWADDVHVFPEANLITIEVGAHCLGGGCDFTSPPHFFDATTLTPLTDLARLPVLQRGCGQQRWLLPPIAGRTYRTYAFQRYVTFNNLMVYTETGALLTWRDGLRVRFINPQTAQAYLAGGDILDLATLTLAGRWPDGCILAYDEANGLLYTAGLAGQARQGVLHVLAQQGGLPPAPPPPAAASFAGHALTTILPSPSYAQDQTLLVVADQRLLFRSTDSGAHWQQVRGGLPEGEPLHLQIAFSPNYGRDRTLFAAGYRHEGQGEGVWRSIDGGDTWQPRWQGLTHLRISQLIVSPAFADDQTVLVQGSYYRVDTGQSGASWQQSTDGGLHWSVVATSTYDAPLPAAATIVPALTSPAVTLPVRLTENGHRVEYTPDQGATWQPVSLPLAADEWAQTVIPAPTPSGAVDKAVIYVLSDYHLWRTTDGGRQWAQWVDPLTPPRTYANAFRTVAISPPLAGGVYQLFLGTTDGHFLMVDPAADWLVITP